MTPERGVVESVEVGIAKQWHGKHVPQHRINTQPQTNCWKRRFLCCPARGYTARTNGKSSQSEIGVSGWSVMSWNWAVTVCGWRWGSSIVGNRYLATSSDDRITNRRFCVDWLLAIYREYKSVRPLWAFVVMSYKSPINPIINLNSVSSH
jgi:hypothetical protein